MSFVVRNQAISSDWLNINFFAFLVSLSTFSFKLVLMIVRFQGEMAGFRYKPCGDSSVDLITMHIDLAFHLGIFKILSL